MGQLLEITLKRWHPNNYLLLSEELRRRAIYNFMRGCVASLFYGVLFPTDQNMMEFIRDFQPGTRDLKQGISGAHRSGSPSRAKAISNYRYRPITFHHLPITEISEQFVSYVKVRFPDFNGDELYAISGAYARYGTIHLVHPWGIEL